MGVIGVGKLGQHHARIYASLQDVELVGVVDIDKHKANKIADKFGTAPYTDYHELLDKVDAVSVVVPTPLHYEVSAQFLNQGVHCLIEKPITIHLKEAEELVSIAQRKGLILQVGHIERFNPVVIETRCYIHSPKFIEVSRLGPYDPRVSEVGVVLDLMIHDLDIVLYLTQSKIVKVDAVGSCVFSQHEDIANVRLECENGCVANISASRISLKKSRKIRIFQNDSYISLDYEKQKAKIYRKKSQKVNSFKDIEMIQPRVKKNEPLLLELEDYIKCIQKGTPPIVDGTHGRNALELALEVVNAIKLRG